MALNVRHLQLNYSQVFAQIFNSRDGKKLLIEGNKKLSERRCSPMRNVSQFNACIALNLSDEDKALLVIHSTCSRLATFHHLKATLEFHFFSHEIEWNIKSKFKVGRKS